MKKKPFYKTSEFWASALTIAGSIGAAYANQLPAKFVPLVSAGVTMAYTISRGLAKTGQRNEPVSNP